MEFIRIGEKLINLTKIEETIRKILHLRQLGLSQQEVATKLLLDRTFISRLETMGAVRRGGRMGLMAFPVANKEELVAMANSFGIEQQLILSDRERWQLVEGKSGLDFFHQVMDLIEQFRRCDLVLVFCSAKWKRLAEALLDCEVLAVEIGSTPISGDVYVDPKELEKVLEPFINV
ncbi:MAG: transcriptional regulator [Clostridium sp.]|jgi:transcriptional regulator with XRE-family HTH domain|nr:transcriptional regulator [Clostridium sp.]